MPRANPATPTLIGLPYDASSSFLRGAAAAPPVIRQALHSAAGNPWTETGVDLGVDGALADVGDVPLAGSSAEVRTKIEASVRTLLESGGRPIVLGGDHSITYPVVRAVRWSHPRLGCCTASPEDSPRATCSPCCTDSRFPWSARTWWSSTRRRMRAA